MSIAFMSLLRSHPQRWVSLCEQTVTEIRTTRKTAQDQALPVSMCMSCHIPQCLAVSFAVVFSAGIASMILTWTPAQTTM